MCIMKAFDFMKHGHQTCNYRISAFYQSVKIIQLYYTITVYQVHSIILLILDTFFLMYTSSQTHPATSVVECWSLMRGKGLQSQGWLGLNIFNSV